MTARRPADIAADLREWNTVPIQPGMVLHGFADELDVLDARWPTADEIAELRADAQVLRNVGRWMEGDRLAAFLDRLDPPEPAPQADDDVDPCEPAVAPVPTAAPPSKPERQIIHELCLILAAVNEWGSEAGAIKALPEWLVNRYRWACVQASDDGFTSARAALDARERSEPLTEGRQG